jgi:hypothetical protein
MQECRFENLLSVTGELVAINLPSREDRLNEFGEQLRRVGLSYKHPQVRLFAAVRPEEPAGFPTLGARGCFLSHLIVLRNAVASTKKCVLICEDDLDFTSGIMHRIGSLSDELQRHDWSIFYGGYEGNLDGCAVGDQMVEVNPNASLMCSHFYAVRGPALEELVAYLEAILLRSPGDPAGGPMHYDGALSRFRADFPNFVTLAASPPLGHQRSSRTDIHINRWFDRLPIARDGVNALRRMRNKIH